MYKGQSEKHRVRETPANGAPQPRTSTCHAQRAPPPQHPAPRTSSKLAVFVDGGVALAVVEGGRGRGVARGDGVGGFVPVDDVGCAACAFRHSQTHNENDHPPGVERAEARTSRPCLVTLDHTCHKNKQKNRSGDVTIRRGVSINGVGVGNQHTDTWQTPASGVYCAQNPCIIPLSTRTP